MTGDTLFSRRCYSGVLHKKFSLRSRRNKPRLVTSAKQCREPSSRAPVDSTIQKCVSISFHPDWQMDNTSFNRPIMARTQIRVHMRGPETRISALLCRWTYGDDDDDDDDDHDDDDDKINEHSP